MNGRQLRKARNEAGLTQKHLADRLGVSQAFLSMLEHERRQLSHNLSRRLASVVNLSPTLLSPSEESNATFNSNALAATLGALGYQGFRYLRDPSQVRNPAAVLAQALRQQDLEPRLTAALPWLVRRYAQDLDWAWLVALAKQYDLQNRLGFLVTLAKRVAETRGEKEKVQLLDHWLRVLESARLAKTDTLCRTLTDAETRFFRSTRPADAEHWNLLTNLRPEDLADAA